MVNMSAPLRWMLLNFIILPFRPSKVAPKYQQIWTKEGSPLLIHGKNLAEKTEEILGPPFRIIAASRVGEPSIEKAIETLLNEKIQKIVFFPLFPQYASSTTGSVMLATCQRVLKRFYLRATLSTLRSDDVFY